MKPFLYSAVLCIGVALLAGCRKPGSETDLPDVNTPRPNPIVVPTNQVGVPSNAPVEHTRTNR